MALETNAFNTALAKKLQGLKKDLRATNVRQGYKGTGTRECRRQIFVSFSNDKSIDLWLELDNVGLGGVIRPFAGSACVPYEGRTVDEVYADVVERLRVYANAPVSEICVGPGGVHKWSA